jgi:hypothetical protein
VLSTQHGFSVLKPKRHACQWSLVSLLCEWSCNQLLHLNNPADHTKSAHPRVDNVSQVESSWMGRSFAAKSCFDETLSAVHKIASAKKH